MRPWMGTGGASKASKRGGALLRLRESGEIFVGKKMLEGEMLVVGKWEHWGLPSSSPRRVWKLRRM
jgi:hypothetical protein